MGLFDQLINSVKETVEQTTAKTAQSAAPAAPAEPQEMTMKFGTRSPVPYCGEIYGSMQTVQLKVFGNAEIHTDNAEKVSTHGGLEALNDTLTADIVSGITESLSKLSAMNIRISLLPAQASKMTSFIKEKLEPEWKEKYGVSLDRLNILSIALTEDSRETVEQLKRNQALNG